MGRVKNLVSGDIWDLLEPSIKGRDSIEEMSSFYTSIDNAPELNEDISQSEEQASTMIEEMIKMSEYRDNQAHISFNNSKKYFLDDEIQNEDSFGCICMKIEGNDFFIDISYSDDHKVSHQRFTIFHEVGHFKLHILDNREIMLRLSSTRETLAINREGEGLLESQANIFSANYLAPVERIISLLSQYNRDIQKVADELVVSAQVVSHQIKNHIYYIKQGLDSK